jgi:hypothetical protein
MESTTHLKDASQHWNLTGIYNLQKETGLNVHFIDTNPEYLCRVLFSGIWLIYFSD